MLDALHSRLAGVVIECLSYGEFLARYDRPGALFYLDPPYWGSEGDYGRALFSRGDFGRVAGQLRALSGRFIMSVNDVSEIREISRDSRWRRSRRPTLWPRKPACAPPS